MKKIRLLKNKKLLLAVAGVLVIIATIVILTRPKEDLEEDIIWREYQVAYNDITASLDGGGTLETTGVHHSFDVDLKIEQILAEVGQEVKTGDVLVKYSPDALKEKITELNASLKKAQRALEDAKNNRQKAQLENGRNENEIPQDTQTGYESEKKERENAIRIAEQKIKQLQGKNTKLKLDLENAAASADGSTDSGELKELREELARLQAELKELESDNPASGSDGQIGSLNQQRSNLETQLHEVNSQVDSITKDRGDLNALRQQLAAIQEELLTVRGQITALPEGDLALVDLQVKEAGLASKEGELQAAIGAFLDESGKLEELIKQGVDLENQISSIHEQISSPKDAAQDDAIKKKQVQIDEVQKKITALSSKEEKTAALREQIQQVQTEMEAAQFELETQQMALNALNSNHAEQTGKKKENQATQGKINALNDATLDNAVKNAQADVEKIQKDLEKANEILTTPELTANDDGVVTELKYAEGDEVPGGKSIVTVGSNGEKRVVTQISQEDIGSVEIGQEVEMQFLSTPDETLKGHVLEKSLVPSEGGDGVTYKVTIAFEEEQPELLQGMTCSVKFILKRVKHVLTLSNKAIKLENGKQIVTVLLPDGTHEEREIQTGFSDGRVSEITGGLSDGEIVVTEG